MFNDIVIFPGGGNGYIVSFPGGMARGKNYYRTPTRTSLISKDRGKYVLYHNITVLVECRKVEMRFQEVKYVLMLGYVFLYISGYIQCVNSLDNNLHYLNFY